MFLDERITDRLLYGSSFMESFADEVVETRGGNEYVRLLHPYPRLEYTINLLDKQEAILLSAQDFYKRAGGRAGGFRVRHSRECTTNNYTQAPTFNDQPSALVSDGVYQITRWYGDPAVSTSSRRRIRKPVAGTVGVGIRDGYNTPVQLSAGWSVDNTTGQITFSANVEASVESISQAAQAVVGITGHGYNINDSVHFSGVLGMLEINDRRGTVVAATANSITVDIDTSGFSAYTSAGQLNTRPQANEAVVAGCEFDIPMRFDVPPNYTFANYLIESTSLNLVEKLNP